MSPVGRLLWGIGFLTAVIVTGVIGYMQIEGWPFIDAIYIHDYNNHNHRRL